ncbi:DinB family protein [Terriglobus roseus]|uniref:Uncharacterized damage-inducible protein DinB (Forms a four-helix bundle) n=1 Tax=Terriglobus roseus TaxID=392734 RepID=A0A1H4TIH7_9BACT|nr:DinB family protein [Terriglobus roseus]SEC56078.1 Uncharacterized damage-inducible protein DinB (forms a four-helix bundle) [Terriglobus roseus]
MDAVSFFRAQLEREQALNRKVLQQVPEGKNSWKPHEKSMEFGYLAALVAQMPGWIAMMIATDGLDLDDKTSGDKFQARASESNEALWELAEENYLKAKSALEGTTEEHLEGSWAFRMRGVALNSGPRLEQIADTFTHMAHHRGQLTVYLRLLGAKVPATYGPSADEKVA